MATYKLNINGENREVEARINEIQKIEQNVL